MTKRIFTFLAISIALLGWQPGMSQQVNKTTSAKTVLKRCYILVEDLISKLKIYARPTEHYHKVKGYYTWQETVYNPVELEGSGDVEVRCE